MPAAGPRGEWSNLQREIAVLEESTPRVDRRRYGDLVPQEPSNPGNRQVTTSDGLGLAVREHGDPQHPTVLCVHGYPDNSSLWDGVVGQLAHRFHVVVYDVRGAGESQAPEQRSGYGLDQLARDLVAVADEVSPRNQVHLLAHDWGSVQSWHALSTARGRIASLTSISGPCLDHTGPWFAERLRHPTARGLGQLLAQLGLSSYTGFFQVPLLPELAWRAGLLPRIVRTAQRIDPSASDPPLPAAGDGLRGLELYRANMFTGESRAPRRTDVPVQVLAPKSDLFITPALQTAVAGWVDDLVVHELPGGHWIPRSRPGVVAEFAAEHVDRVERTG